MLDGSDACYLVRIQQFKDALYPLSDGVHFFVDRNELHCLFSHCASSDLLGNYAPVTSTNNQFLIRPLSSFVASMGAELRSQYSKLTTQTGVRLLNDNKKAKPSSKATVIASFQTLS